MFNCLTMKYDAVNWDRMMKTMALCLVCGVALWLPPLAVDAAQSRTVRTESGSISGALLEDDSSICVFKGIPYAAPPVGVLRWKPPQPAEPWKGVRDCDQFGNKCLQKVRKRTGPFSEDCLFLNVWAPAKLPAEKLPVMVWIHGGGLTQGSAHEWGYMGDEIAKRDVILVSINYRLGAFGFLSHPALTAESEHGASGNYGILDQIHALKWVRDNIAAFGGDPGNVTIFGESAGGTSVYLLVASPLANGLFHKAILQSAWIDPKIFRDLKKTSYYGPSAEEVGVTEVSKLLDDTEVEAGNTLEQLRAIPAEQVLEKLKPRLPVVREGWLLPDFPSAIYAAGKHNQVPTIAGTNRDEGTMFTAAKVHESVEEHREAIGRRFPEQVGEVLELYGVDDESSIRDSVVQEITDVWFVRPTREYLRAMQAGESPAWMYHFTRNSRSWPWLKAAHAAEIPYVFNTLDETKIDDVDRAIASAMIRYWTQFAQSGDPNAEGMVAWPAYDQKNDQHLEIGDELKPGQRLRAEACDLMDRVIDFQRQAKPETTK